MTTTFRASLLITSALFQPPANALEPEQWQADLSFVAEQLTLRHANPWDRMHRRDFERQVGELKSRLPSLDDGQIAVELMGLVAQFEDGHTKLLPTGTSGFTRWYPLRFHWFTDGIYLTAGPGELQNELRGQRVDTINGRPAEQVMEQVTALFGADNRFGQRAFAFLASSAEILEALGITAAQRPLRLVFEGPQGEAMVREFAPEAGQASMEWRFWGEFFGPQGIETTSIWGPEPMEFYTRADPQRPLHLRQRNAYHYEFLANERTLYLQLNYLTHKSNQAESALLDYVEQALARSQVGDRPANRLIIDIRYNFGGDGSMTQAIVNRILRGFPQALDRGHVFVLTSGATFSAGVMLAEELRDHLPVIFVGEPMGAPWNSYGDAEAFTLPNSGYQLDISRRWWQLAESDDDRRFIPVQIPTPMTGRDYFAGRDPALDHVLDAPVPYPSLDQIVINDGGEAAEMAFVEMTGKWGDLEYWQPVGRMDLEHAADLLTAAGRIDDAVVAYRLNTVIFPLDWDTWDDLGQICHEAGDDECTGAAYEQALLLNPTNWNAADQRAALTEIADR